MTRKRLFILLLACLFPAIVFAITEIVPLNKTSVRVNPGQLHTARDAWTAIATTAAAGDEPNDLAADERTYLTVLAAAEGGDTKIATFLLHSSTRQGWNRVKFRMRGVDNNQENIYQVYLGTLGRAPISGTTNCELAKVGQLAFTTGQQASVTATYEMADTLTVTPTTGFTARWTTHSATGDLIAEAELELDEADVIVIVPTTVATNAVLIITGY